MEVFSLEVYAKDSNYAVIKPPGRAYPGCVIQGDSLAVLCDTAQRIVAAVQSGRADDEEFLGDVEDLNNKLIERILHYQRVLIEHGIPLPYARPFGETDLAKLVADGEEKQQ